MRHNKSQAESLAPLNGRPGWLAGLPIVGGLWARLCANRREFVRFCKWGVVGAIGAVVDFAVLNVLKVILERAGFGQGWNVGLEPHQIQLAVAGTVSFFAAVLSNFTWNRLWTFPESRDRPVMSQLAQFTVVNVMGWGINTVLLLAMDHYVFSQFVGQRLSYNLAKAFAIGVVLLWNFGVNRIWTYRGIE